MTLRSLDKLGTGGTRGGRIPGTARQNELLRWIHGFQLAHGYSPSFTEMAAGLGISTRSTVAWLLDRLEERGLIAQLVSRRRGIEVLAPPAIARAPDGAPLYFIAVPR